MTHYGSLFRDRAQFLPAVQEHYHIRACAQATPKTRPLPGGLSCGDLDFLEASSKLFTTDGALISAGQFGDGLLPAGMMRRRPGVMIMGDSGGFQAISGRLDWRADDSRALALQFAERFTDVSPILDIPTAVIGKASRFETFGECLAESIKSADFALNKHPTHTRLLGVLQGRSPEEADVWDAAMMKRPLDGWAFGGALRLDMFETGRRVVRLVRDGLVSAERNHIHIFGTARLDVAVMLTALQQGLREYLNCESIKITFDSSAASMTLKSHRGMAPATMTEATFAYRQVRLPMHAKDIDWPSAFPFRNSAIGRAMKISDLCVDPKPGKAAWDSLSLCLVTNHNVETMLQALDQANSILELRQVAAERLAPVRVVRACAALRTMFRHPDPLERLAMAEEDLRGPRRPGEPPESQERQ